MPETPMTPDLDAIRERWASATPGPWAVHPYDADPAGFKEIHVPRTDGSRGAPIVGGFATTATAEAIAAAPTDVAALVAEVERLRAKVAREHTELRDRRTEDMTIRGILSPNGQDAPIPVDVELVPSAVPGVAWLAAEVTRLRPMETALAAVRELLAPDSDFYDDRLFESYTAQFICESVLAILDEPATRAALDGGA